MPAAAWSDAPVDILWCIIERLPLISCVRFGAVCVSWHSALAEQRCPPAQYLPWLMLSPVKFHSLSDDTEYRLPLMQIPTSHNHIGTSTHGWLHSLNSDSVYTDIHLFQPISGIHIKLPSLGMIHNAVVPDSRVCFHGGNIKVAILCSTRPFVVAATSRYYPRLLVIITEGEESWTTIHTHRYHGLIDALLFGLDRFIDMVFYKEHLYLLSHRGTIIAHDLSDIFNPRVTQVPQDLDREILVTEHSRKYLVESSDDLLLVWRKIKKWRVTTDIKVFKMEGDKEWLELKSLEDHALFLTDDHNHSLSLSVKDARELQGNCVYFMDYLTDNVRRPGKLRVYHIGERCFMKPPSQLKWKGKNLRPVWFTPTNLIFSKHS